VNENGTVVAESWEHLMTLLFEESWQQGLGRFRSHYAYKGLTNATYDLTTSLMRLGGDYSNVERHLLRNFRKYAQQRGETGNSLWNWLGLAQHHGLPTRLLDWTYSPLVALHFSTASGFESDRAAAVWCVDYVRGHESLPCPLREVLDAEGSDVWTTELLDEHVPTWEALHTLGEALLFFEPPSLDQRIVNQYALFSVLPDPCLAVDTFLERHPDLYRKVVIPAPLKWEVRDKLDQANVNERVLFPGLDGLCSWLRRHYSPSPYPPDPEGR
jgi:hypothetical protein